MNKWNDFLKEEPPLGHAERVQKAVVPELKRNRLKQRREFFGFLTAGAMAASAMLFWVLKDGAIIDDVEWVAFQEVFGNQSEEDLEFLMTDAHFEMLEDLDVLEEMEDV